MRTGLVIYDSLATISGGYLFDRMLVSKLEQRGDIVTVISLPRRPYALNSLDNFRRPPGARLNILIQDELTHPSLFLANRRTRRQPVVCIVHHLRCSERRSRWENAFYREVERLYFDSVDGFIFNSAQTRASVLHLTRSGRPEIVAMPGADRLGTSTEEHVRQRALTAGPLQLLYLGAVVSGKGLDVLLRALDLLPGRQLVLDVIGSASSDPAFARRMQRLVSEKSLPVTFWGILEDAALEKKLRGAHVMVLPSYHEGFGIAYAEGMAHGLPAIGTTAGAIPEIIAHGENGFVVAPGDATAVSDHLEALIQDRELVMALGMGALRRFRSLPTWNETTDRMREFLLSMAAA